MINDILTRMDSDTNRVNYERGRANLGSDRLDKHAFMQLLMAKLRTQDPLNPVEDADFMSQQAQLAQVEKLDDLVNLLGNNDNLASASTLIGKMVDVMDEAGNLSSGVVDSAVLSNGQVGISIGDNLFNMKQVVRIYNSEG